ncbi:WD40/YVTN/BNR-like repeat-containing protein [Streptomyces doebereineriae]|uniref:Glycosyl hydrolase n=1 Tax=Streptomyces doebereineriae TaxID=3075528 RepID=A0ABU2VGJ8_9ACTN|nr:glycosyl hydrolase [Streptomyces sp. DSM 41640]MDT0484697.1 glycosyl hydrolase [Streptomyces sp. DSM 41640]
MDGNESSTGPSEGDAATTTPLLEVSPPECRQGMPLEIRGTGWQSWPVRLTVDGQAVLVDRVLQGLTGPVPCPNGNGPETEGPRQQQRPLNNNEAIRPDGTGTFLCRLSSLRLELGQHRLEAAYAQNGHEAGAKASVVILARHDPDGGETLPAVPDENGQVPETGEPQGEGDRPFERDQFHWERRFGHLGRIPPGVRETQISQVRALRERRDRLEAGLRAAAAQGQGELDRSAPVVGMANWTPLGAGPVVQGGVAYSGRALSLAIDPTDTNTVYLGTANGGVWKSTDRGLTWSPKSDYQRSLAIGALAVDPNDHLHVVAGTGEMRSGGDTYYGNGLLSSLDGGNTWTELGTSFFERDEITRLVFDPTDTTGKRLLLSSTIGVCESTDGGVNWANLINGWFTDMVVLPASGPAGSVKVIAAKIGAGVGLWTSTRKTGTWSGWTAINDTALLPTFDRVAMAQQASNPNVALALFSTGDYMTGLAKTTNGGTAWSAVPIRLNFSVTPGTSTSAGHSHSFSVPAADMSAPATAHTYTSTTAGTPSHNHTITFTAQEFARLAGGGPVNLTTTDATGHSHTAGFLVTGGQAYYNLHVAVHPTNADILFLGEAFLWRSTTGGVFDRVDNVHADHHELVFDPVNPATCWEVNDGGVQMSTDTGVTWSHRNRDLATLQYWSVAQHPEWENVLLGGTQDNGVQRYGGTPAWPLTDGGDGGFTAIDPSKPTRMYKQYRNELIYRSDNAGALGSWSPKTNGITGGALFYAPFAFDPTTSTTCYFGGEELWRSTNSGDTWFPVTSGLGAAISAIAVHPGDSNTIYIGTQTGRVYLLQRTGATWNPPDVPRTDLTAPPLPFVYISDLAVDPAGTVWVTIAGMLNSEQDGEFSNDHIYRRGATDNVWTSRSNGLAQANPINTIVIDPANSNRLFCGADIGVFRTENAGLNWLPWDQGLPNAPVFDLALHSKRRLLRAATHGRSVWERPVDAGQTKMVDLYVRDTVLDSGRVQPSPSGVADPFDPSPTPGTMWWWQSPDILVDAPEPNYQTTNPVGDYVALTQLAHRTARRDRTNRFYVQVHNRGVSPATNVRVRAFLADASAALPALPPDFWSSGKPFVGDPTATNYTPIGPTQTIAKLEAAEPGVVEWDFLVPNTAAAHSCVLAVATCDEDPIGVTGIFDITTLVTTRKHAALKNLQVENAVPGGVTPSGAFILLLNNPKQTAQPSTVVFEWASLPEGTQLYTILEKLGNAPGPQLGHGVEPLPNADQFLPDKFTDRNGQVRKFDFARSYVMKPDEHRKNELRGVHIDPERGSRAVAVNVRLPEGTANRPVEFHVLQEFQNKLVGGSTYVVRPTHPEQPEGARTDDGRPDK